jgi:hypothetical protein
MSKGDFSEVLNFIEKVSPPLLFITTSSPRAMSRTSDSL